MMPRKRFGAREERGVARKSELPPVEFVIVASVLIVLAQARANLEAMLIVDGYVSEVE